MRSLARSSLACIYAAVVVDLELRDAVHAFLAGFSLSRNIDRASGRFAMPQSPDARITRPRLPRVR